MVTGSEVPGVLATLHHNLYIYLHKVNHGNSMNYTLHALTTKKNYLMNLPDFWIQVASSNCNSFNLGIETC